MLIIVLPFIGAKRHDDFPKDIYGGNMLLIYDWNGNPIRAIKLENIYRAITITPDSDTILLVRKNDARVNLW